MPEFSSWENLNYFQLQTLEESSHPVHADALICTMLKEGVHFCLLLKPGHSIKNCKFLFLSSSFIVLN